MFKINKKIVLALMLLSLMLSSQALAAEVTPGKPQNGFSVNGAKPAGINETSLAGILTNITNYVLGFITIVAVLMLIWGGVQYLTAAGDEAQVESAKHTIMYAIIGLIVVGISYAIMVVVVQTFIQGQFG